MILKIHKTEENAIRKQIRSYPIPLWHTVVTYLPNENNNRGRDQYANTVISSINQTTSTRYVFRISRILPCTQVLHKTWPERTNGFTGRLSLYRLRFIHPSTFNMVQQTIPSQTPDRPHSIHVHQLRVLICDMSTLSPAGTHQKFSIYP